MGFRQKLAWSVLAACFACLPCVLHAQSTYTIHIPDPGTPAKFAVYVAYSSMDVRFEQAAAREFMVPAGSVYTTPAISVGDWEVTVAFDLAHCGIYCAYRRKRDASGRTSLVELLSPPITSIQVYANSAAKPAMVSADPAGLAIPAALSHTAVTPEILCIPVRKLVTTSLVPTSSDKLPAPLQRHLLSLIHNSTVSVQGPVSLRI